MTERLLLQAGVSYLSWAVERSRGKGNCEWLN